MAPSAALVTGLASSLFFVVLNVAMNVYTKWLFSDLGGDMPLPWTMLAVQQVQSFMVLHPTLALMRRRGWDKVTSQGKNGASDASVEIQKIHVVQVFLVTLLFCVNVGLNSLSLVAISITLNQTVRAFLPVGVLLLGCCIESQAYPLHSYGTTSFVVVGIALTCCGNPDFTWYGFSIVFVSTLMAAVGTSLNGRLLNNGPFGKSGPYGVAQLIYIQSIPAIFIFAVIAYFTEGVGIMEKFQLTKEYRLRAGLNFLFMTFSSVLALLNNLGRCFLVAATSPLTETIAGNAKVAVLCVIDHQLFGTVLTGINYVGIVLTFLAFTLHLLLQYASREDPEAAGRRDSMDGERGRRGSEDPSGRGNFRRPVNRPRIISAADTGLAAEHLAVELGREPPQFRRNESGLGAIPELPRYRSMTWPQPANDERRGMWTGVDLSLVFELPPWLSGSGQPGNPEDYLSVASLSPMARRQLGPSLPSGGMSPTSAARSRFFSDPRDDRADRARLLEDVRLGSLLHAVVEEDMCEPEPAEPPRDDRARSREDVRLESLLHSVGEEAEMCELEPAEPPDLDWL